MGNSREKKTPVILVKKRRVFSLPPENEQNEVTMTAIPDVTPAPATSDTTPPAVTPDAATAPAAAGKKKKGRAPRRPRPPHWTREFTDQCVEKVKAIFPHLRAEGGGFLPLKVGISRDIPAWLAEHPDAGLTLDEWECAVFCITSRRVYLQRTSVPGAIRYDLDGKPAGQVSEDEAKNAQHRLVILERRRQERLAAHQNGGEDTAAK
ncbi:proQ/FINO family protein [Salmonella enterica subsp. enterica serovar 4,[5],12:b:-]|nr:proQ/FINO family protein [Salmonella enterica subsp. enterica serovar 4,[5],12:b:-]